MTIDVVVNGKERSVPSASSLKDLLEQLSLPSQRIAIELNKRVVRRSEWADTLVSDGDRLEIVHFVGGG